MLLGKMGSEKGYHFGAPFDDETRLMVQAAGGDAIAFAKLYKKYLPFITVYLASLNGFRTSAQDVVQEIFMRLWQNRAQFRADSTFKNYLYGIVRNVLSDERKRLAKQVSIQHDHLQKHSLVRRDGLSEPDSGVCWAEIEEAVEQAITKLTAKQRQVVRLFYFEQMTSSKIMAKYANCSTEAFRSRLRRAHGQLRQLLNNIEP